MKKVKVFTITLTIIFIVVGSIFVGIRFDKKNNYSSGYKAINAYNYIINANYFTGYIIWGCSAYFISAILIVTSLHLHAKSNEAIILNQVLTQLSSLPKAPDEEDSKNSDYWKCSKRGRLNAPLVGTCGCGHRKE